MRYAYLAFFVLLASSQVAGQEADSTQAPKETAKRTSSHPYGDTSIARMTALAYTDSLPAFDRLEIYAVSMPKPFSDKRPKEEPDEKTFPVRPYKVHADIHAQTTITDDDCGKVQAAWQALAFDRFGGAMCHFPAYGLRFYRKDLLLYETTVCWKCQNFYLPSFDSAEKEFTYGWYGFANDDKAKHLLKLLQRLLPHPRLTKKSKADE